MKVWSAFLAILIALGAPAAALACPYCSEGVSASQPAGTAGGAAIVNAASSPLFNTSIYFMLGGFFCVVFLVVRTIVKGIRGGTAGPQG